MHYRRRRRKLIIRSNVKNVAATEGKLRFLVTAGGTREYIDPVRFISNASSGRMGYELARAAVKGGHRVTLITAPTNLRAAAGVDVVKVESAYDMFEQVKGRFGRCDCLVMAAAVSDYTPSRTMRMKMKKNEKVITLKLKPTLDILKWTGTHKRLNQIVVGFALEDRNIRANAEKKLREKNLDMIVTNRPEAIGKLRASVEIKTKRGRWLSVRRAGKRVIAGRIIRLIEQLV
jgi:phosphopantothenoylcysteine decarboxylase/phosphopantothenate--cysteine ligase